MSYDVLISVGLSMTTSSPSVNLVKVHTPVWSEGLTPVHSNIPCISPSVTGLIYSPPPLNNGVAVFPVAVLIPPSVAFVAIVTGVSVAGIVIYK